MFVPIFLYTDILNPLVAYVPTLSLFTRVNHYQGNVRLHNTANEFLSRRLLQSGLSPSSPNISPESSVSSTNSNTGLNLRTINGNVKVGEENELKGAFHASRPRTEMETGMVRANNSTGFAGQSSGSKVVHYSPPGSGANNNVTILGEAMEQAEILRVELNRVHAGLSLLSHSVDRLGDVVTVNSKWYVTLVLDGCLVISDPDPLSYMRLFSLSRGTLN